MFSISGSSFASDEVLDRVFSALSHPIRRDVLTRLARRGDASVSELAEPFDVSLMAVSRHVRVLEEAGLVRKRRDGRVRRCSFDAAALASAGEWVQAHRRFWEGRLEALGRYLEGNSGAGHESSHEEER